MANKVGGEVMTANRDLFIATCWKCEKLLGNSEESPEELSEFGNKHIQEKPGHFAWVGPVTVEPMIGWLEKLLVEQGLRREE